MKTNSGLELNYSSSNIYIYIKLNITSTRIIFIKVLKMLELQFVSYLYNLSQIRCLKDNLNVYDLRGVKSFSGQAVTDIYW